jgi:hypothetical protein
MSKNLERVIQRAISDAAFRRQLQSDPAAALRGFKLTDSEVAALRSGDAGKLTSLGIDQRMSKTFTFAGGDLASRVSTGGDLTSAGLSQTDRDLRLNSEVTPGGDSATGSAITAEGTSGATKVVIPGVAGDTAVIGDPLSARSAGSIIADPDNPASARTYVGDQAAAANASVIADPDNPASARTYVGDQAGAPTSDALEDQSHAIAARGFADSTTAQAAQAAPLEGTPEEFAFRDQAATANASIITDPDNPASARGYVGDQATASRSADVGGSNTGYGANYPEHGGLAGQSADVASSGRSVIGDPDNPVNARGYVGDQAAPANASITADPDNPANARGYVGDQAVAPTSDALEDQSHAIAARGFADSTTAQAAQAAPLEGTPEEFAFRDQAATANASIITDPDNPASARTYVGDQAAAANASIIADPDNPASARGYVGDQATAPTSEALEDQSHAIAARGVADSTGPAQAAQAAPLEGTPEEFAFRDQGTGSASIITDPDNPANARGYTGEQPDAFLAQDDAGQYSADPNWSSDQAEDTSHAFNPDGSEVVVDEDVDTTSARNGPDVPV